MLGAIKNIIGLIGIESGNLAGVNVTGYKKKTGSIDSSGDGAGSIGNDLYVKTDNSQGALISTKNKTDLAIQGKGFFVLFDGNAKASFDPNSKLSTLNADKTLVPPVTSGTFTVNGNTVVVNAATDSFKDVLSNISSATGGTVQGYYDAAQNAVTLTNTTGIPGSNVVFGASPSSNFLTVARLTGSAIQPGSSNNNYLTSTDPVGSVNQAQQLYFTRDGSFNFNGDGYLVNNQGLFVGGIDPQTGKLVKIDKKAYDGSGTASDEVHFAPNGILFNDTQLVKEGKQLALANFAQPDGLKGSVRGGGLLEVTAAAGVLKIDRPDKSGFGLVKDQNLEASNSSTVDSLTNLSILQRFFPSTVSALKVSLSLQDDLNAEIK
ncbi:MAG: hypothetical protein H7263_04320 [Candidatus Sericytochromatia bacterium]|nr:hypothetical protein [Candidatus Sericytochromatia bacterium]